MVLGSLKNTEAAEKLHPLFKQAFDYIKANDLAKAEPGKIELDGKNLFISVQEITGKTKEVAKMETHNKYIDIQIPVIGVETMGWLAGDKCVNSPEGYNETKDITFFTDAPATYVDVHPGEFVIFFPEDGHAPAIGNGAIKKLVVKVLV
ncbi:MAG: YhcH/YjgK/YiaL family protein [Bacteroidota bacterium]|nr:YhcH/YjgK/YiaL family protein [Bacteroidota bacterium]